MTSVMLMSWIQTLRCSNDALTRQTKRIAFDWEYLT